MYKNGKIYTVRSYQTDKFYIGSTCNSLSKRMHQHIQENPRNINNGNSVWEIVRMGDAYIELLENCPCDSRSELLKRQGELIRENKEKVVNTILGIGTKTKKKKGIAEFSINNN